MRLPYLFFGIIGMLIFGLQGVILVGWFKGSGNVLSRGLARGLLLGVIGGLSKGLLFYPEYILTQDLLFWKWRDYLKFVGKNIPFGIISSTILVFMFDSSTDILIIILFFTSTVLVLSLVKGLIDYVKISKFLLKTVYPYQRFRASAYKGNFAILRHLHLRRILRRRGYIPKDWVHFLQTATKHHILESDGGSWRFRHRILQEYFLEHWRETIAKEK
jgi:hypothetical protein